ncbi:MAG: hypothetical protein MK185_01400 [Saccharospirillaceae bacterium]|nr:hypothetical protein A3759_00280 [Thalassolituus sp. HI0120]MCH2039276.1 hypothetical protein [Saccharospirillaceae bacterium]
MATEKHSLIKPLVDHLLSHGDTNSWRVALVEQGVMSLEETMGLDEAACRAAFKAMKMMQLLSSSVEEVMLELDKHQISWNIEFSEDFQQGAICY